MKDNMNEKPVYDRDLAEESLRASEERFKRLIESVTDYIFTVDIEAGRQVATTHGPGCITVTGYSSEDYASDPVLWYRMIHEEDKQAVLEQMSKILAGKTAEPLEHRIIHKDSSIRWVRNTPVLRFDSSGNLLSYDGLIANITERKQAEEALRISEEKYRDIFEWAVEGIFQSTPQGKYVDVNPAFASMLGYESPKDMIANVTNIQDQLYVFPEERDRFMNILEQLGTITGFENQNYRKDGKIIWISINARVVRQADGKVLYYEGTALDITERKQADEEKERLQTELRHAQKMEAIGTLAGGIAHDFNNILSIIMGYATIMQMDLDIDNPLRMYADQIVSSSEKAATLTRNLLSFSKKQPLTLKPVNLNDIINKSENVLKRLLPENIDLKNNLTPDEIIIMGDETQINQILFNLAGNARDAMPNGGLFIIGTKLVEMDRELTHALGYGKPGKFVLVSFSDTGIGMDAKTREHIFDPFFTTKEVGKGTGLGLSSAYGIVKQHNGYISVYSEPNMGTTFHVYFPLLKTAAGENNPDISKSFRGKETILVAEDNESIRLLMKTILTNYGYTIIEAIDGQDAIDKFNKHKTIDLIITDLVMPKKNGKEVYDEIVKTSPDIKVLFTSGYAQDIVLDKGIENKEINFIPKPVSPTILLEKIRKILDKQ